MTVMRNAPGKSVQNYISFPHFPDLESSSNPKSTTNLMTLLALSNETQNCIILIQLKTQNNKL